MSSNLTPEGLDPLNQKRVHLSSFLEDLAFLEMVQELVMRIYRFARQKIDNKSASRRALKVDRPLRRAMIRNIPNCHCH